MSDCYVVSCFVLVIIVESAKSLSIDYDVFVIPIKRKEIKLVIV